MEKLKRYLWMSLQLQLGLPWVVAAAHTPPYTYTTTHSIQYVQYDCDIQRSAVFKRQHPINSVTTIALKKMMQREISEVIHRERGYPLKTHLYLVYPPFYKLPSYSIYLYVDLTSLITQRQQAQVCWLPLATVVKCLSRQNCAAKRILERLGIQTSS